MRCNYCTVSYCLSEFRQYSYSRQIAMSLQLSAHSLVCRPCRNDTTRLTKDPDHHPRWEKCQITECVIPECKNTFFSNCSIPSEDILQCLTLTLLMHVHYMRRVCMYVFSYMGLAYIHLYSEVQVRVHMHEACMYVYMCMGHAIVISSI